MFIHQVTEEISLKYVDMFDAQPLYGLIDASRPYLREWLPFVDATVSVDNTRKYIQAALQQYAAGNGFQAVILWQGVLAGAIGFHSIDWANRSTSLGYWLAPALQGRGIMTQSCRAMVSIALREYDLNRVEIQVATGNHKSAAIPQRLGFEQEGIKRQAEWLNGRFVDHAVYSLLAEQWSRMES